MASPATNCVRSVYDAFSICGMPVAGAAVGFAGAGVGASAGADVAIAGALVGGMVGFAGAGTGVGGALVGADALGAGAQAAATSRPIEPPPASRRKVRLSRCDRAL